MKFKVDQNLATECASLLKEAGHDAMTVYEQNLGGAPDERIVTVCQQEGRVLVTADLDLSDIRQFPPGQTPGMIILRMGDQSKPRQLALLRRIILALPAHPLAGRLWIVEEDKIRIRGA